MDQKIKIKVSIFVSIVILLGFMAVGLTSYATYSKVIKDDIVNISKLTATNIYSDISNELTKPIFVSLTMANDNFLKNWLKTEAAGDQSLEHQQELQNYLLGIKKKYNYNSVFLVSDSSKYYYHYQGINKKISPSDDHDQWYYTFLNKNLPYYLDIDTDEVNQNQLSIFVNCRITDDEGNLLGVTGVGLELHQIQSLLASFDDNFDLEAMLFNKEGLVQIHSNTSYIKKENVFDLDVMKKNKDSILDSGDSLAIYQFNDQQTDGYIITRFIEDLDWYLLIKKDTSVLARSFRLQIINDVIIFIIVTLFVLFIVNRLTRLNEKVLTNMAKIDSLTNLPNRRGFNEALETVINDSDYARSVYLYIFDIDNFKNINDLYGHLIGDKIVRLVGQIALGVFSPKGVISRWGGDEFAGFIYGEKQEAVDCIELFFKRVQEEPEFQAYSITVSLGAVRLHKIDTGDTLTIRADKTLYAVKESGKNNYRILDT